jgi:hypothetical protein
MAQAPKQTLRVSICLASRPNPSRLRRRPSYSITSYPTGRLFWVGFSRHFVPGYDRTVSPGQFATAFSLMLLRNVCRRVPEGQYDRSLARSAWKSVPRKNRPVGYGMIGCEGRPGRLSRALNPYTGSTRDFSEAEHQALRTPVLSELVGWDPDGDAGANESMRFILHLNPCPAGGGIVSMWSPGGKPRMEPSRVRLMVRRRTPTFSTVSL